MTREVSREESVDPVLKGAVRPDQPEQPPHWRIHITGPNGAEMEMTEASDTPLFVLLGRVKDKVEEVHEADAQPPATGTQPRREPGPKR